MKLKEIEIDAKVHFVLTIMLVILCIVLGSRVNKLEKENEELYKHFVLQETKAVMPNNNDSVKSIFTLKR